MTTLLGLLAGVLTTGCWLPQLIRSWRTRSTSDISWTYLSILMVGVGLWLAYGLAAADLAVVLANGTTGLALLVLTGFKITFDRRVSRPGGQDDVVPDRVDASL